jgi:undecaprenyl-diphosphatase
VRRLGLLAVLLLLGACAAGGGLNIWQALLLGAIEGITEYLPVSSTGHLAVATRLLGLGGSPAQQAAIDSYLIVIQAGAIAAVVGLYVPSVVKMLRGLVGRDTGGRRLLGTLVAAFVPAGLAGFLLGGVVKDRLFGLVPVAAAWIAGGLLILWVERRQPARDGFDLESLPAGRGLLVGVAQTAALWPGVSRSLVTILAGQAVGMSRIAAVEFSFLLGALTLGAATGYEAVTSGGQIVSELGLVPALVGFVAATGSAVLAVRWLVSYLSRRSLAVFGWYRLGIGVATLLVVYAGGATA